jgi:hypothetical protein
MAPLALRRASASGGTVTYRELLSAGRRAVCLYGGAAQVEFQFGPRA